MKRLNKRQTKEMKKKVAKLYYRISKILFTVTILCALGAFASCATDFRYSSIGGWVLTIAVCGIVGTTSFVLSISIQKFLNRKGYLAKSKMICRQQMKRVRVEPSFIFFCLESLKTYIQLKDVMFYGCTATENWTYASLLPDGDF